MEPLEEITLLKYYKDENGSFIFDENGYVLCDVIDSQGVRGVRFLNRKGIIAFTSTAGGQETSFDSSEVEWPSSSTQTSLSCPSASRSSKSLALTLDNPTSEYKNLSTQTSTTRALTGSPSRSLAPALHVPTSGYKAPSALASSSQILTNHLSRIEWNDRETTLLLNLYIEWFPHIGPTERFMYKRNMWAFIAKSLKTILDFICNGDQCENHFKTIIRMWSDTLKKKRASGGMPHDLPWREQYEKVIALDDSILPEVLVGMGRREYLKEISKEKKKLNKNKKRAKIIKENNQPKNAEVKDIVQVMCEISNTKEENKKKHWEEKKKILEAVYKVLPIDEDF